jgi:hypothetical protein
MFLCFALAVLLGALEEMLFCVNMLEILSHLEDGSYYVHCLL